MNGETPHRKEWQLQLHEVIFEADTPAGKTFDVALMVCIVLSVLAVMLESVTEIEERWGFELRVLEWVFTALFSLEYVLRLLSVRVPRAYARSFFGIVDLLAVLPTYLSIFLAGSHTLIVVRTLRLVRVFRVFKLTRYLSEAHALWAALRATRARITVFLVVVTILVVIIGAAMYLIEGNADSGFTSIPRSVYWAIVTMTTVGYGDIAPQTFLGQTLAAGVMILGYSIIIVPIGVFSVEIVAARGREIGAQTCTDCGGEGHDTDAAYCKHCGAKL